MSRWWRRRYDNHSYPEGESGSAETTAVTTVDDHNFSEVTSDRVAAVDFWAPWCGPCRSFAPVFEKVARRYEDQVVFGKCNVDGNGALATRLEIQSLPTVVLFSPGGNEIDRVSGLLTRRELERTVLGALQRVRT